MRVQAALRKEDIEGRFMKNRDMTVEEALRKIAELSPVKIVLSNVADKEQRIQKVQIEKKEKHFQIAEYTDKQVFHKNVDEEELISFCIEELGVNFLQLNAWMLGGEASVKLTKKGKLLFSLKKSDNSALADEVRDNNRKKNYILEEGRVIEPLVERRTGEEKKFEMIKTCPICSSTLERKENQADWYCLNPECPAKAIESLIHFVSRNAMYIEGLGEEIIEDFYNLGYIKNYISDFRT